ncbi:MAG: lipopolysaccharide assembly protein LapA domain-containing protein [Clostridia bacterium]
MKIWVAVVVFALLVAIVALQNARPVPVAFLWWTAPRVSFSLVVILSVLFGALGGMAAGLWDARRRTHRRAMHVTPADGGEISPTQDVSPPSPTK